MNAAKKIFLLELIDGLGKEKAVMVDPPINGKACRDDLHCAHHGSGPFFCCKCGAGFVHAEEPEAQ